MPIIKIGGRKIRLPRINKKYEREFRKAHNLPLTKAQQEERKLSASQRVFRRIRHSRTPKTLPTTGKKKLFFRR